MAATAASFDTPAHALDPEAWLKRLPAETSTAFVALREMAKAVYAGAYTNPERFAILEALRGRAITLLREQRSRYLHRAVPLEGDERAAWESCVGLWGELYLGYALCTETGNSQLRAATIWQRALDCLGRAIREHAYAYRAVPAALWKELNSSYRCAEECALHAVAVEESDRTRTELDCRRTYLATVLHESANQYALSTAQMQALEAWLPEWLEVVELTAQAPLEASRSPLAVDLSAESGAKLARALQASETLRYLDSSALAPRLRDLAQSIRGGALTLDSPEASALPRAAIERLLTHVYIQWCSAGSGRGEERKETSLRGQAALNMHGIHFQISGRAFRQPGSRYTREEEHDLATFGHITERTEHRLLTARTSALEPWEIVNQGSSGMLSVIRKSDIASHLSHGQLVAIRTSSIDPPRLALVQRLRVEQDGALCIGLRVVPGEARGAAVRPLGDPTLKYERALAIDADADRKIPAQLVLPAGKFALGAAFELHTGRADKVKVTAILDAGPDHDRVAYESV